MNANPESRGTRFDLSPPTEEQFEALQLALNEEEREVLLEHDTEPPFCGSLIDEPKRGVFTCRLCGLPLFHSSAKFESGTGWPSFAWPLNASHIKLTGETNFRMAQIEVSCARCGGHQGHVFSGGPPPTGKRYCINSVSLEFISKGDPLPDKLGRGAPEGEISSE